jgi:hypothetical protein
MANRKLKTWAEVKSCRPLSAETEAANAMWVEQQIVEIHARFPDGRDIRLIGV